jgi:hypothetical protein
LRFEVGCCEGLQERIRCGSTGGAPIPRCLATVAPCRIEHLVSGVKQRKAEQDDVYTSAMIVKMAKMMDETYRVPKIHCLSSRKHELLRSRGLFQHCSLSTGPAVLCTLGGDRCGSRYHTLRSITVLSVFIQKNRSGLLAVTTPYVVNFSRRKAETVLSAGAGREDRERPPSLLCTYYEYPYSNEKSSYQ